MKTDDHIGRRHIGLYKRQKKQREGLGGQRNAMNEIVNADKVLVSSQKKISQRRSNKNFCSYTTVKISVVFN